MTSEPRKASDILLELEQKLDVALSIIRAQDLNIKILSNKLNTVIETLEKKSVDTPKVTVEAVSTPRVTPFPVQVNSLEGRSIPISSEDKLPIETEPQGFRRTSRPETFAGDDAYLPKSSGAVTPRYPVQTPSAPPGRNPAAPPPGREAEVVVPPQAQRQAATQKQAPPEPQAKPAPVILQNAIPIQQRGVNASGKSLFLADVEIIDASTMQSIFKTRTNGTGKWMASLGVGNYRVIIRKLEAATKEKLEVTQDIEIDGSQSPLELQTVIIKS